MGAHPVAFALVLALVSAFNGFFKWHDAPNPVPAWWNIDAHPIYYLPKWVGFTLLPVLTVVIPYIFHLFSKFDTKLKDLSGEHKHSVAHLISLPALFFFVLYNFIVLEAFVSQNGDISPRFLVANVALFFLIWAGYNFQFVPPNYSIGILTPWTVRSERSWVKTHNHSAWVLGILGLALLIVAFTVPTGLPLLVVTLVLWLGSYLYLGIFSLAVFGGSEPRGEITEPLVTEA
ncbi:hypothetical protein R1sor_027378 [Riccia sorocarpa]|uniref:DUF1648 domain-containing protein n=1 Tax=Riccia sorocarpa TaxID=122646 RepID=A0ABD3GE17_9MARC